MFRQNFWHLVEEKVDPNLTTTQQPALQGRPGSQAGLPLRYRGSILSDHRTCQVRPGSQAGLLLRYRGSILYCQIIEFSWVQVLS